MGANTVSNQVSIAVPMQILLEAEYALSTQDGSLVCSLSLPVYEGVRAEVRLDAKTARLPTLDSSVLERLKHKLKIELAKRVPRGING